MTSSTQCPAPGSLEQPLPMGCQAWSSFLLCWAWWLLCPLPSLQKGEQTKPRKFPGGGPKILTVKAVLPGNHGKQTQPGGRESCDCPWWTLGVQSKCPCQGTMHGPQIGGVKGTDVHPGPGRPGEKHGPGSRCVLTSDGARGRQWPLVSGGRGRGVGEPGLALGQLCSAAGPQQSQGTPAER